MATYTLRRRRDGATITTTSPSEANDLVANGTAELVPHPSRRTSETPENTPARRKRPAEADTETTQD